MGKMLSLTETDLRNIAGGDHVGMCLIGISGLALGIATAQFWAAAPAAFDTGYNCGAVLAGNKG